MQKAHDVTDSGGDIFALDATSDYGRLTITKAITIYAPASDSAARPTISVATGNAITVNAAAGDTITLVNLALDGQSAADNGIQFNAGFELRVFGGVMRRFKAGAPNGFGIKFTPAALGKLLVREIHLDRQRHQFHRRRRSVNPQSTGGAQVLLSHVRSELNAFGLAIDTNGSTNGVNATIQYGQVHYNRQDGVVLVGGAPIGLLIKQASNFANSGHGVRAIGGGVNAQLNEVSIAGNGVGVAGVGGGTVLSYGNNSIDANGTNGTPTLIPLK